ncbi:MAG: glycosyltransferase family 4 protein [Bdellovibrionales bacterium]|nr:glycosyltransferase family 4 protein [Bdellovibrionales bacterium]
MAKAQLPRELNICIISKRFPLIGRAAHHSYLVQIAKGLTKKGHHVSVISSTTLLNRSEVEQDGIHAYFLNQDGYYNDEQYIEIVKEKFSQLHSRKPFHIVHCMDRSGIKVLRFKKQFGVTAVVDVEATRMSELFSILGMSQETAWSAIQSAFAVTYKFIRTFFGGDRVLLKSADGVFVTSPQQRLTLERYYLYPDRKTFTVSYGIELSEQQPIKTDSNIKQKLGIPSDAFVIITFSDMTETNESEILLNAFERTVIKKPNTYLVIVGNGPQRQAIEFMVYNRALGSKVIFTGAIKNVDTADYIEAANIYISLSSKTSGFELSLLEAMLQKKIIIGSEVSGLSTFIEDGKDGFLVRPADTISIYQLFLDIIHQQIDGQEIGENAKQKIIAYSDTNKMIGDCINAYFAILKFTKKYKVMR